MKKEITFNTIEQACPSCGHVMNKATCLEFQDSRPPVEGDMTICLGCAEIMVFGKDLKFRMAELNDLMNMKQYQHKEIEKCQRIIREHIIPERNKKNEQIPAPTRRPESN